MKKPLFQKAKLASALMLVTALPMLSTSVSAGVMGYYNLTNPGSTDPASHITGSGHTAVQLGGLSSGDLNGLDVLWVLNPSNGGYDAELTGNSTAIANFVNGGGRLMFHDRRVTEAATVIPGATGVTFVRDTASQINLGPDASGALLTGPGGTIDDTTLDGGGSSNHGYAIASTLPAGSGIVLTTNDASEVVDFYYSLGGGQVYYSAIPLDHYLGGSSGKDLDFQSYATNLSAFIFELVGPSGSPAQFQHIVLTDSAMERINTVSRHLNAGYEGVWVDGGYSEAERGDDKKTTRAFDTWGHSLSVGYNQRVGDNLMVGGAFHYDNGGSRSTNDSTLKGDYEAYSLIGSVAIGIPAGDLEPSVQVIAGATSLEEVELTRGDRKGKTAGYQSFVDLRASIDIGLGEQFTLAPVTGVAHVRSTLDDYVEKGNGAMAYDSARTHVTYAYAGAEMFFSGLKFNSWSITPTAKVVYKDRVDGNTDDVDVSLASLPTAGSSMSLYHFDDSRTDIAAGVALQRGETTITVEGAYGFGPDDLQGSRINIGLSWPL